MNNGSRVVGRRSRLRIDIGRFYTECLGWHRITLDNLTVIWIHALIRLFKLCRDSAVFRSAERGTNRVPEVGHIMCVLGIEARTAGIGQY